MHQIEQGLDQAHLSARASYWHGRQCPRDHLHSSLPHLQLAALVVAIIMAAAGTPAITVRKPPWSIISQAHQVFYDKLPVLDGHAEFFDCPLNAVAPIKQTQRQPNVTTMHGLTLC
jgi:hypothetical protein